MKGEYERIGWFTFISVVLFSICDGFIDCYSSFIIIRIKVMVYSYCICPPCLAQAVEAAAGVVVVLIVTLDL